MSEYVLSEDTALIVNREVYVLAREKEVTNNTVCGKCDLYDKCIDIEDNHKFASLCMPNENDQRWFFKRNSYYPWYDVEQLVKSINSFFLHK